MRIDRFKYGSFHNYLSPNYGFKSGGNGSQSNEQQSNAYHLQERPPSQTLLNILNRVLSNSSQKIGDFGCGDGHIIWQIKNHPKTKNNPPAMVYGIDIDEAAISKVQRIEGNFPIKAYSGDITKPEFLEVIPDGSLDVAFSWRVIHGMAPEVQVAHLKLVNSKLVDGAKLHLAVLSHTDWKRAELESRGQYHPNRLNECAEVMSFAENGYKDKKTWPLFFFTEQHIQDLARATGFTIMHHPENFQEETGFDYLKNTGDSRHAKIDYLYVVLQKQPLEKSRRTSTLLEKAKWVLTLPVRRISKKQAIV